MKRFVSALLACAMVLSALTVVTVAADGGLKEVTKETVLLDSKVDGVNLIDAGSGTCEGAYRVYDTTAQSITWSNVIASTGKTDNGAGRRVHVNFGTNGFTWYKGRKFEISAQLSATDKDGKPVTNVNMFNITEDSNAYTAFGNKWVQISGSFNSEGKAEHKGTYELPKNLGTFQLKQFKFINKSVDNDCSIERRVTLHSMKIKEIRTYFQTKFNIGTNGAVSYSYADLDGKNAVTNAVVNSGDIKEFEKYTKPEITVNANEGYVINTLSVGGTAETKAEGKKVYTVTPEISGVSEITVTFCSENDKKEEQQTFSYITLSGNKTFYLGASDTANASIDVKGYKADGTEVDITGSEYLTYETSNSLVFPIENGRIKTTDQYGMAIVSATYVNKEGSPVSASVIFQRSNDGKRCDPGSEYKTEVMTGHVTGSETSLTKPDKYNNYGLRGYEGSNKKDSSMDWKTNKHRVMTSWCYYDGTNKPGYIIFYKNYKEQDASVAFDYADNVYTSDVTNLKKGWHQFVFTIDSRGVRTIYIDGVAIKTDSLKPNQTTATSANNIYMKDGVSYIEMRADAKDGFYYDDFSIADYTNVKPEYSVTVKAEGGAVTAGTVSVGDGKSAELTKVSRGSNVELKAANGYKIASIKRVDTLCLTEGANIETPVNAASYTISNVSDDLVYEVKVAKENTTPTVEANNMIYATSAFSYTTPNTTNQVNVEDGTFSIVVYASIDGGLSNVTKCGFTLTHEVNNIVKGEIDLPAFAVPTGDGKYALRVFGAGIESNPDGVYKFTPYIVVDGQKITGTASVYNEK